MDWTRMCNFWSIQAGYVTLEKKHVNQIYMKIIKWSFQNGICTRERFFHVKTPLVTLFKDNVGYPVAC